MTGIMEKEILDKSVQYLKGVGPAKAKHFHKLGIHTVRDLLMHYPREYVWAVYKRVDELEVGDYAVVDGTIHIDQQARFRGQNGMFYLKDGSSGVHLNCAWFGCDFINRPMTEGRKVVLWGKITEFNGRLQMVNPKHSFHGLPRSVLSGHGLPIYAATKDLPSECIAKIVGRFLDDHDLATMLDDQDEVLVRKRGMFTIGVALDQIHRPASKSIAKKARDRIVYNELYRLCLRMHEKRTVAHQGKAKRIPSPLKRFYPQHKEAPPFDFQLTTGQNLAIGDIAEDMRKSTPMYRLLQGDVGCGKTAVAIYASLLAAEAGLQTVVMVPTKILAQQHFEEWSKYTDDTCLLTSDTFAPYPGNDTIPESVVIATTSCLSDKIKFHNLGLLVVDEQHRFGVKQKDKLVEKYQPHQLYMTATPIPRAIALTAFGDLDVSSIREMPANRGTVSTKVVLPQEVGRMWEKVGIAVKHRKQQAYDVYPRIHGPGGLEEAWMQEQGCGYDVGYIHGQEDAANNESTLRAFRDGECKHLMCTSMLEVGVHVPNANVMVVHEAHMFGLSQLHQLRGRIGRGSDNATCYLLADTDDPEALERLYFLERVSDGFQVAEEDLRLRGPGELTGVKQHGMPELKLADLVTDYKMLLQAKEDVKDGTS